MLAKILYGYKATQCLYVAAKLNIADFLMDGEKSIVDLAILTQTNQEALYRIMRCLVSLGVFSEDRKQYFSLNKMSEGLLSDSSNSIKDFIVLCGEELYQSAGQLLFSVKTNRPAFDSIYHMNHWEYLNQHPDKAIIFNNAMQKGSRLTVKQIIESYDFSPYSTVIDIGGGKGHLAQGIIAQHSHITGAIFDLMHAKDGALDLIHKNSLEKRCKFLEGDFFTEIPATYDLYLLKVILHDWDDEKALVILKNIRRVIKKTGKILIIEKILDEENYNDMTCLGDINMLVTLQGKERSLAEFNRLLGKAGFDFIRSMPLNSPFSLLEAAPI